MSALLDPNSFVERTNERAGPAWHGETTHFYTPDEQVTCREMVIRANGDFTIIKAPMYALLESGQPIKIEDQFSILRGPTVNDDKHKHLGSCGKDFVPFSNLQLADMLDRQLSVQWPAETCGIMEDGSRILLVLKVGEYDLLGMKDEHNTTYCMAHHDKRPGGGLDFTFSEVRAVCSNTVAMAIEQAQLHIKLKQTGSFLDRLESIMDLSAELQKLQFKSREVMERLALKRVVVDEAQSIINAAHREPTMPGAVKLLQATGLSAVEALGDKGQWMLGRDRAYKLAIERMELYRAQVNVVHERLCDEFPAIGGTAYAVVQAVAEHADHSKGKGDVVMSRMFGDRADSKKNALHAAVKLLS